MYILHEKYELLLNRQINNVNFFSGTQVNLQPRMRSIGVQFNGRDDLPAPQPPLPPPVPVLDLSSEGESTNQTDEAASLYEPSSASSDDSQIHDIKLVTFAIIEELMCI